MDSPDFDRAHAMEDHLGTLLAKKEQLQMMIDHVSKTIKREKGMIIMTDQGKFEGLKAAKIAANEEAYGPIRPICYKKRAVK